MNWLPIAAAVSMVAPPSDITPAVWHCTIQRQVVCQGGACEASKPAVKVVIEPSLTTYLRCDLDGGGCSKYDNAVFATSGAYLTASIPGRAMFARISGDHQFSEVVTLGHAYLIASGSCEEGPPLVILAPRQ